MSIRSNASENACHTWWGFCPGGGVLPIMAYTGRFRPKGVPFSGFSYMKGLGFYSLKYTKGQGNMLFWSVKGPQGLTDEFFGFVKSRKRSIVVNPI